MSIKTRLPEPALDRLRDKYRTGLPRAEDKASWLAQWEDYRDGGAMPADVTENTWRRLLDAQDKTVNGVFLYDRATGELAGFAHYILHAGTWHDGHACYVEDGYVAPPHRPRGAMLVLYEAVIEAAKRQNCRKLYWMTMNDNVTARRFYDRIAKQTGWIRYEYDLETTR